jgi:hypothetical protein
LARVVHNCRVPSRANVLLAALATDRAKVVVLAACWLFATVLLFVGASRLQFSLTNIDGISYMRIAEMYANGWLPEAFNAYWSPLISWTMLPFMALGVSTNAAFFSASALWSSLGLAAAT